MLISSILQLRKDEQGAVAMIFAIMLVPLIALLGVLVDTSRAQTAQLDLQNALDSAVLAAAKLNDREDERLATANRYFPSALPQNYAGQNASARFAIVDNASSIRGQATATVTTLFGGFIGSKTTTIGAEAKSLIARPQVRHLDLVMCIDATGSMQNTIDAVKNAALTFEKDLNAELAKRKIDPFESMRIKPIFYRDFGGNNYHSPPRDLRDYGDRPPMKVGSFWRLPDQAAYFSSFVKGERASGGGDLPESGLECINEAMGSDWTKAGASVVGGASAGKTITASFNVVAVWTDADAHPPGHALSLKNPDYPPADVMPRIWSGPPAAPGITEKWNSSGRMDRSNRMLVFFGNPGTPNWIPVRAFWQDFFHGGTLTEGTSKLVSKLADAIATKVKTPVLTH